MDTFSRKIVGWSIDSVQNSSLVVNALDMAIKNRLPAAGGIVHADHGVQFTSWSFGEKIRSAGLMPSFGTVGDGLDNAMIESFWSSMQIELLNRQKWRTRVELANAMFDYIEIFHNRRRRHSQLGYRTPMEHELAFTTPSAPLNLAGRGVTNRWGRSTSQPKWGQSPRRPLQMRRLPSLHLARGIRTAQTALARGAKDPR
jgi:transposase InsO family protein